MRIMHFTDSFYPSRNGVATYLINTVREQAELGHEVVVVAPSPGRGGPSEEEAGKMLKATVIFKPSVSAMVYPDFRVGTPTPQIVLRARKFNPDVIHFHTTLMLGFEGLLVAKLLRKPLVGTFHTYFMEPESLKMVGLRKAGKISDMVQGVLWSFAERFYRGADVVIAPTKYVEKDLKKRWKWAKTCVVPGGIKLDPFKNRTNRQSLRKKNKLKGRIVLLWVGRLSHEKSLEVMVAALSMIVEKYPKTRLAMVGDGPAREGLKAYAQALGIADKVVFLGSFPYEEIVKKNYYSIGDIFVSSSTFETQGLSVNEAMAAGLPVVGAKAKVMPGLVGRRSGILFKPDDPKSMAKALLKLIGDKEKRKKLGERGQKEAEKYSLKESVVKLGAVYKELIKERE